MARVLLFLICLAAGATAAQEAGEPADEPGEPAAIDVETATSKILTRMLAVPRFEEEVEVRDRYQEALDAYLAAAALECEPPPSEGPPSPAELDRFSANPKPPSADLLAAGRLLAGKLKESEEPRFFLYSIRRQEAPERVVYVVRDGEITESARTSIPGTEWKLVGRYSERDKAADALERLERGFASADGPRDPRTLWAAAGCDAE
jgi:hypothetical protein